MLEEKTATNVLSEGRCSTERQMMRKEREKKRQNPQMQQNLDANGSSLALPKVFPPLQLESEVSVSPRQTLHQSQKRWRFDQTVRTAN